MLKLSRMGVTIFPPVAAFYTHPRTLDDMVNHIVMRVLDQFDIHVDVASRWDGIMSGHGVSPEGKPSETGELIIK
jgi:4-hydroxy-3-polyprenylbenzoate decarboxylase